MCLQLRRTSHWQLWRMPQSDIDVDCSAFIHKSSRLSYVSPSRVHELHIWAPPGFASVQDKKRLLQIECSNVAWTRKSLAALLERPVHAHRKSSNHADGTVSRHRCATTMSSSLIPACPCLPHSGFAICLPAAPLLPARAQSICMYGFKVFLDDVSAGDFSIAMSRRRSCG
jgi:hypothetical protein